jgi:hypothetical protein
MNQVGFHGSSIVRCFLAICLGCGVASVTHVPARAQETKTKSDTRQEQPPPPPPAKREIPQGDVMSVTTVIAKNGDEQFRLTSNEGDFSFTFPAGFSKPQRSTQTAPTPAGDLDLVLYVAGSAKGAFVIGYVQFKRPLSDSLATATLDGVRTGLLTKLNGQLEREEVVKAHGGTGRVLYFNGKQGEVLLHGRSDGLLIGDKLYQLLFLGTDPKSREAEDVQKSFMSFQPSPRREAER